MNAFEVFEAYMALKLHFTKETYDYHKFQGKTRLTVKSFENRKDKYFFEKLTRHADPFGYLLANFVADDKAWIRGMSDDVYKGWKRRQESLSYLLKQDLDKLDQSFNSNLVVRDGEHPVLLRLYLAGDISLETLSMIVSMSKCQDYWNDKMSYDPVWEQTAFKIRKYAPFIDHDKEKIKNIIIQHFED